MQRSPHEGPGNFNEKILLSSNILLLDIHYGEILKIISIIKYSISIQLENNMNTYREQMGNNVVSL